MQEPEALGAVRHWEVEYDAGRVPVTTTPHAALAVILTNESKTEGAERLKSQPIVTRTIEYQGGGPLGKDRCPSAAPVGVFLDSCHHEAIEVHQHPRFATERLDLELVATLRDHHDSHLSRLYGKETEVAEAAVTSEPDNKPFSPSRQPVFHPPSLPGARWP